MAKILRLILSALLLVAFGVNSVKSQTTLSSKEMVAITPVVCTALDIDSNSKSMLNMKLMQVVTANGFASTSYRYALVPNIVMINKQVAPTVPVMYSLEFELSLYVVDMVEGIIVAEESFVLKGLDRVEGRAYTSAFNQLNPRSPQMTNFMERSRTSILDYYTTRTTTLLKKAESLAERELYDEAIEVLTPIPESVDEYAVVCETLVAIYKKKLDKEAKVALQNVEILVASEKYDEAMEELKKIDPASSYWAQANATIEKIVSTMEAKKKAALEAEKIRLEAQIAAAKELTAQKELDMQTQALNLEEKAREVEANKSALDKFSEKVNVWFVGMFNK